MKIEFCFAGLILSGLFSVGCSSDNYHYPPSQYIGIYDSYGEYKNGTLPGETQTYTGEWSSPNGLLEGRYYNGIPTNMWIAYYPNAIIHNLTVYYQNGKYYSLSFYPDGMPFSREEGEYRFENNQYIRSNPQKEYWDFEGNIINSTLKIQSNNGCSFKYSNNIPDTPLLVTTSIQNYSLECLYYTNNCNFSLVIFLIPIKEESKPLEKIIIKGKLVSDIGKVNILENKSIGTVNFELIKDFIINDNLNLTFESKEFPQDKNTFIIELPLSRNEILPSGSKNKEF